MQENASPPSDEDVALIRRFNRAYTRQIGLLNNRLDGSPFSLVEARVLYEIAHGREITAAEISRTLNLDRGHLSRILSGLKRSGLVASETSSEHAKKRILSLTAKGRKAFAALNSDTSAAVAAFLKSFAPARRLALLSAAQRFVDVLQQDVASEMTFTLRDPRPGDIGWVIHRQSVLYTEEYGWDWTYEGLISKILGDFIDSFDPSREKAWIAESDGAIAGSIFLKAAEVPATAKLRLLYVEPSARGKGIGAALTTACIKQAKAFGYRRLDLWTNSVLVSARRIYEATGFRLMEETPHASFGKDLVGQVWTLNLAAE